MKIVLYHSRAFTAEVDKLATRLARQGIQLLDPPPLDLFHWSELKSDQDWESVINELKTAARVFVVEPGAERDGRLRDQWQTAIKQSWAGSVSGPLLPILVGDAKLPGFLKNSQAIKVERDEDWSRVADCVAVSLKGDRTQGSHSLAGRSFRSTWRLVERLDEIAREAGELEPTREELVRQVELLRARIHEERDRKPGSIELAELHVELADGLRWLAEDADALPELNTAADILAQHSDAARRLARVRANLATLLGRLGQEREALAQMQWARDLLNELGDQVRRDRPLDVPIRPDAAYFRAEWAAAEKQFKELQKQKIAVSSIGRGVDKKTEELMEQFAMPSVGRFDEEKAEELRKQEMPVSSVGRLLDLPGRFIGRLRRGKE